MKQKLSSRILIVLISVVMLLSTLPLNSLIAFANEYTLYLYQVISIVLNNSCVKLQ